MQSNKILLIHLFSNGDCLFATIIARQIKTNYPNCTLTWMVSSKCQSMLLNNNDIDEIISLDLTKITDTNDYVNELYDKSKKDKDLGIYKEVFCSQIIGDNYANYDGIVCTSIFKNFGQQITVNPTTIINLTELEKEQANQFAVEYKLNEFKNIVLFECAPQSGQLNFDRNKIENICNQLLLQPNTCVILSAPSKYNFENKKIIDGCTLSIRATAAFTHYCTLLLGCSSGISWIATSTAAKQLPTIQILDKSAYYYNPLSITFKKLNKPNNHIIELVKFDETLIGKCFENIIIAGIDKAYQHYHQPTKVQLKLIRGIVSRFIQEKKFNLIKKLFKNNIKENGLSVQLVYYFAMGFIMYPFYKNKN